MTKIKNIIVVCVMALVVYGFFIWGIIAKDGQTSASERRKLAQFPKLSKETAMSGEFMDKFEKYTLDQFPLRDDLRSFKAVMSFGPFMHKENNKIYIKDGYISKLEYPLSLDSLEYAAKCFDKVYDLYLDGKNVNIYAVIVPDKNYFLAKQNGYPSMNYDLLYSTMSDRLSYMKFIDVRDLLTYEDYYKTDTHWRQEKIVDVADRILSVTKGVKDNAADITSDYVKNCLDKPFYGVYYGQAAIKMPGEELIYLTSDILDACSVLDYETGKTISIYDMSKSTGNDLYEVFLSGSKSLLEINNPKCESDAELVIFRDSFASAITPLLVKDYKKITIVDIRYLLPSNVGRFVEFDNQDILFLYSTLVLNNSVTIKIN